MLLQIKRYNTICDIYCKTIYISSFRHNL